MVVIYYLLFFFRKFNPAPDPTPKFHVGVCFYGNELLPVTRRNPFLTHF